VYFVTCTVVAVLLTFIDPINKSYAAEKLNNLLIVPVLHCVLWLLHCSLYCDSCTVLWSVIAIMWFLFFGLYCDCCSMVSVLLFVL
jgi:hypothetical protein